jgi:hypothetical protein
LITLDRDGARYVFRVIDAGTGHDAGAIRDHEMPDWASSAGLARDALSVDAAESADGLRIEWTVRRPYRGGAPPPDEIARQAQQRARGALVVDPKTAAARAVAPESAPQAAAPEERDAELTSSDPEVVALAKVEDRIFSLRMREQAEGPVLEIEARRSSDGTPLWQTTVEARQQGGSPRVRP